MKTGSIYIIKNNINDKVYIGQTTMTVRERFMCHMKPSTAKQREGYKLYNAVLKYGKDNFYYEILEELIPLDKINDKEIYYIKEYNSYNKGYNSTPGGDGRIFNKLNNEEEILELAKSGMKEIDIAEKYNVNPVTINRLLHRLDFSYYSNITKEQLKKLIDTGMSNQEIADELKLCKKHISRLRVQYGLSAYNKRSDVNKDFDYINFIKDFESGMKKELLCKKYDITRTTAYRYYKNYSECRD